MARSTVKISAQFKKGVSPHIIPQVLGQKYPNLSQNWRPGGAPKWHEKSDQPIFPPFSTHKNLHKAPNCSKSSLVGRVPTDLPAKEFLKKLNPVLSYGPKRDGASHRDSRARRLSRFRTNLTKFGLERLRGKISTQWAVGTI